MKLRCWLLASVLTWTVTGAAAQQTVVAEKSEIRFISKQMNVPVDGRFKHFTAKVNFDPAKLENSRVECTVDLLSIDLGMAEAEVEVKGKAWFDTANTPRATFVSTGFKSLSPGKYQVAGKLSLKGISRDIVVPFTTQTVAGNTVAEGRFMLSRRDYRLGDPSWNDVVADGVEVVIKMTLAK